jgi:antitoxin HicB
MRYRILLAPDDNDTLLVTCPDLPEVTTFGEDEIDARFRAVDAIITALQGRINARQDIPEPSEGEGEWIELGALSEAKIALYRIMRRNEVTKADLGRRLDWHGPSVDRLLDLDHDSRFQSVERAFKALGHEMHISLEETA